MSGGIICVGILVTYCFVEKPIPTDSFCLLYDKVIVEQGDSKISAPLAVKKRLLANELKFKRLCKGS